MMFFQDLIAGGAEGLAKGAGQLARDLRAAITGKEAMTAEQQASVLARADAMEAAAQQFEHASALGQIDINKLDAQSGSLYKGGWRPAVGWVCAAGIGYEFLLRNLLPWSCQVVTMALGKTVTVPAMPSLDMQSLLGLLFALLGLGGYRMVEKIKGVAAP
jgi:hypothetical protein